MVFPRVMYQCESWTIKKPEHWRINAFELWCWRRLLRMPWNARRWNWLILMEINPEYSSEGLMLKSSKTLATWCKELTHWKDPDAGKDWRQLRSGQQRMIWWDRIINSMNVNLSKLWQTNSERQGSLVYCSWWGCKELDTTEWLSIHT